MAAGPPTDFGATWSFVACDDKLTVYTDDDEPGVVVTVDAQGQVTTIAPASEPASKVVVPSPALVIAAISGCAEEAKPGHCGVVVVVHGDGKAATIATPAGILQFVVPASDPWVPENIAYANGACGAYICTRRFAYCFDDGFKVPATPAILAGTATPYEAGGQHTTLAFKIVWSASSSDGSDSDDSCGGLIVSESDSDE